MPSDPVDEILAEFTRPTREYVRTGPRPVTTVTGLYLTLDVRALAEALHDARVSLDSWRDEYYV